MRGTVRSRQRSRLLRWVPAVLAVASLLASPACSDGVDEGAGDAVVTSSTTLPDAVVQLSAADAGPAAATYAEVAHAAYADAVVGAEELRASIGSMVTTPSEATLAAARQTWVAARERYTPTEVFRFYGGPIDAVVRRVDGPVVPAEVDALVDDVAGTPLITVDTVLARVGDGQAGPVLTGFGVMEYLLWGTDERADGPGARPASDLAPSAAGDRRRMLLVVAADLLVTDLAGVRDQWAPGAANFREQFLADPRGAVQSALQGMAVLSAGEMANRRLRGPLEADGPETEHSRFSDATIDDLVGNARGVGMAYLGEYDGVTGVSISEVVARFDPERDADLRKQLDNNLEATRALPDPFDQVVLAGEDDPARAEVADLADDLQVQGEAVVALAAVLGLSITAGT